MFGSVVWLTQICVIVCLSKLHPPMFGSIQFLFGYVLGSIVVKGLKFYKLLLKCNAIDFIMWLW